MVKKLKSISKKLNSNMENENNRVKVTAEDVLGKHMITLSERAMELWGFECRQGMREKILIAMQEYANNQTAEKDREIEKLKGQLAGTDGCFKCTDMAKALEEAKPAYDRQTLFNYMHDEHGILLLETEMDAIADIINPPKYPYTL